MPIAVLMATRRAQEAHDALLAAKPEGANHDACSLCPSVALETAEEEQAMADERTYTAVEHAALLEAEVKRQNIDVTTANQGLEKANADLQKTISDMQSEKAELLTKVDKAEAEKAAVETAKAGVEKELADFKAEVERKAEVAKLCSERAELVKKALPDVGEEYFTAARTQRWAEMAAADFDVVLADLTETSEAMKKKKKDDTKNGVDPDEPDADDKEKAARETAAFRGGVEPTAGTGTTFMSLIGAKRSA